MSKGIIFLRQYRRIIPLLVMIELVLSACSKDLSEYYDRVDQLTHQNDSISQVNADREKQNEELSEELKRIQQRLDSLAEVSKTPKISALVAMEFAAAENPQLGENLICNISSNGVVECWIPTVVDNKELIPRFSFTGSEVTINGQKAISGAAKYDFTKPVEMTVTGPAGTVTYTINVYSFTGLPLMYIDIEDGAEVVSKETYLRAHMRLVENVTTRGPGDVTEANLMIKGRGNSSWSLPKKPYRLKFDEKISFFNEHKDKSWVLIANYSDKSMLRNFISLYMGKNSSLEWTPGSHFVELFMNGQYCGTYQLCEKIKESNHRVAVGDDGFLLEMHRWADRDSDIVYFAPTYAPFIIIKDPKVTYGDENYQFITNYIAEVERVLFSEDFRDPDNGWQKYLDMDSFVDWYLIHEISKNADCLFNFSTYMHMKRGEKLKMGPLWDFDIAYGNVKENNSDYLSYVRTDGLIVSNSFWLSRLMADPVFAAKVRQRYAVFYRQKTDYMSVLNEYANYLSHSAIENEKKWGTFYQYTYKNSDIWGSYQNEVQSLKNWLNSRMEWLNKYFK